MSNHARFLWTLIALAAMLLTGCPPAEDTGDTGSADEAVAEGHEGHGDSPFHAEGVESAIENIDNGVTVTFTTENADQVTELQEFVAKKAEGDAHEGCKHECACKWEGVTKSYENLDNGVTMTLTAEDAELVTKIQEHGALKMEAAGEKTECGCKHKEEAQEA